MNGRKGNYTDILIEDLHSKMDAVLEIVVSTRDELMGKIEDLRNVDLLEIKDEIHTLRLAVTETNKQVKNHEKRITTLETRTI
jgi:hypothetical protein